MGKMLITFSTEQEEWLRTEAEAKHPGGVSELVRRAVDEYRERHTPPVLMGRCGKMFLYMENGRPSMRRYPLHPGDEECTTQVHLPVPENPQPLR